MSAEDITDKQRLFVQEYLANGRNGTAAAIAAGYSPRSARGTASRLLTNENIRSLVQDEERDAWEKVGLTLEKAVAAVNDVMDNGTPAQRLKAAEMALRRYGQFIERVEVNGEVVFKPAFRKPVED